MYTYTLRKELSVGAGDGEKEEKDLGNKISPVPWLYRGVTGVAVVADQGRAWRTGGGEPRLYVHLFLGAWVVRGGVTGRPEFTPPYWYLAFFSEGFRIWKEHMRDSSTLIMPPALSNSPQ